MVDEIEDGDIEKLEAEREKLKERALEVAHKYPHSLQGIADECNCSRRALEGLSAGHMASGRYFKERLTSEQEGAKERKAQAVYDETHKQLMDTLAMMKKTDDPKERQAKAASVLHLTRALGLIDPKFNGK